MAKKHLAVGLLLIILIMIILGRCHMRQGNFYYVSNDGNDNNSGRTSKEAWKTLEKVNSSQFQPGDTICFKAGGVWRGQLVPKSGSQSGNVKYGSYGIRFKKPQILGSIDKSKQNEWRQTAGKKWRTKVGTLDIGNIIFDSKECGIKKWSYDELEKQNQFFYKSETGELFIYSEKNPASMYKSIECAETRYIIDQSFKSYVTYEGLSLKYGGAHGFGGVSTNNIIIKNCDISYIGGGDLYGDERQVRFGNGIEFWGEAHDNLVEGCKIWEVYDAAVTNQNYGQIRNQYNITYKDNKIWNCEYSFEYWNLPKESLTSNILFQNNNCSYAGGGWGHAQRPDPSGIHLFLSNEAILKNMEISKNTFKYASLSIILVQPGFNQINNMVLKNNKYYQNDSLFFAIWDGVKYYPKDFKKYTGSMNQDKGSAIN